MAKKKPTNMTSDIQLFTIPELLDELASRFDCLLFAGVAQRTDDTSRYTWRGTGNGAAVVGLAKLAELWASKQFSEQAQPLESE